MHESPLRWQTQTIKCFYLQKFKYCAYESTNKQEIVEGIDHLMDDSLVIPTGQPWEQETFLPVIKRLMKREKEVRKAEEKATLLRSRCKMNKKK